MNHIAVIYNSVPDRSSITHDLKSELGLLQVAEGVSDVLRKRHHVSLLPFTGDVIFLMEQLRDLKPDAAFNLFEGAFGLSMSEVFVPIALDLMRLSFTGSPAKTLETCVQKLKTKQILLRRSVPTPKFFAVQPNEKFETQFSFPMIVKPEREDASLGISNDSVVHDKAALKKQIEMIWKQFRQAALCEEFIDGREFNVAIIGDSAFENQLGHPSAPRVLPISEISFETMPEGYARIVSYKAKWEEESVEYKETKPVCPATIELKLELDLKQIALRAFNALGCRDYARVDFRVNREGKPFVVDINPNPDISKDAGLARCAAAGGFDYDALILAVAEFALNRKPTKDIED